MDSETNEKGLFGNSLVDDQGVRSTTSVQVPPRRMDGSVRAVWRCRIPPVRDLTRGGRQHIRDRVCTDCVSLREKIEPPSHQSSIININNQNGVITVAIAPY